MTTTVTGLSRADHAQRALKLFAKTGATIPATVQQQIDRAAAVRAFIRDNIGAPENRNLATVITAALDADRDPYDDPHVHAATLRAVWQLPAVASTLDATAQHHEIRAVGDHAQELTEALQPLFNAAAEQLRTAHDTLGDIDLHNDQHKVLQRGGDSAAIWGTAVEATKTIDTIMNTWHAIMDTVGLAQQFRAAGMVEWTPAKWAATHHEARPRIVGANAWDATRNGWALWLATPADIRELTAALPEAEAQRRRELDEQQRERRQLGLLRR